MLRKDESLISCQIFSMKVIGFFFKLCIMTWNIAPPLVVFKLISLSACWEIALGAQWSLAEAGASADNFAFIHFQNWQKGILRFCFASFFSHMHGSCVSCSVSDLKGTNSTCTWGKKYTFILVYWTFIAFKIWINGCHSRLPSLLDRINEKLGVARVAVRFY